VDRFVFIHSFFVATRLLVPDEFYLFGFAGGSTKFGEGQNLQTIDSSKVEQIFKNALTSGVEVVVVFVEPRVSLPHIEKKKTLRQTN